MTSTRWRDRAWKGALFAALLATTWLLLAPGAPALGPTLPFVDKLEHAALFAVLALLSWKAHADKPRWGIAAALVFYGVCIEIAQPRTGRDFELLDIVADAVGTLVLLFLPRGPRVRTRPG